MELDGELDDITAELANALDGGKPAKTAEETAPVGETEAQAEERLYKRDGRRFVAKEADAPKEGKEVADPKSAKDVAPADPAVAPKQAWKPLWYKNEYGEWEKQPEQFRKALEQREKEAAQGIEKHATAAKAWEPINQALAPHLQELAAAGVSPQQYVGQLIDADKYLRTNPVEALNWLARQYCNGADIIAVADWMTQNGVQAPAAPDPMKQELARLQQQVQQLQAAPQQQERARVASEIENWSKDKPHFEDVRGLMAELARAPQYKGATLDQLYEAAQRAHPQLYERIREDQRKAEVERARTAGATSPRTTAAPNGDARTKPTMSIQEEIAARWDGLL